MEIKPYLRKTQYYETDQMGIIHHANYVYWMEEARVDFMEQMGFGYRQAVEAGIDFAVLGLSCRYHKMVRFGEEVQIEISISRLTATRMTVAYRILGPDGTLRATGESEHCYFSGRLQRPVSLPKALPELYALFRSVCTQAEG
ncbi:MAG: acyl-CoA thioesterase [Provencibacterium sp.]|jgi:acyl-CoA thioester hydrolase|nr:acyl-CoA thioesterase [Provencibacterium sp.]